MAKDYQVVQGPLNMCSRSISIPHATPIAKQTGANFVVVVSAENAYILLILNAVRK
jgi:hypothetical protein